jgi:nucleoside-diphosphate-sugar epimerase
MLRPKLIEKGYEVYNLERYVTGRIGKVDPYQKDTYFADLKDIFSLTRAVQEIKPEIVIHLAAMTVVAYSYAHPQETIETNFLGTVNLAEICTHMPSIKQFIFASSAEVYGISKQKIKKENDTNLIPNTPYAVSKFAAEYYLNYLYKAFNFPITIFRPFNSYGRQ